jgi:hypothetical protein
MNKNLVNEVAEQAATRIIRSATGILSNSSRRIQKTSLVNTPAINSGNSTHLEIDTGITV